MSASEDLLTFREVMALVLEGFSAEEAATWSPEVIRALFGVAQCIEYAKANLDTDDYARFLKSIPAMLEEVEA